MPLCLISLQGLVNVSITDCFFFTHLGNYDIIYEYIINLAVIAVTRMNYPAQLTVFMMRSESSLYVVVEAESSVGLSVHSVFIQRTNGVTERRRPDHLVSKNRTSVKYPWTAQCCENTE